MIDLQLLDRLSELPYRIRGRDQVAASTWPVSASEFPRLFVEWPSTYEWAGVEPIVSAIKEGFARLGILRLVDIPQAHRGVVILRCLVDARPHTVVLDYFDKPDFINAEALSGSDLYIKCQFSEGGYDDPRIVRGGYPVTFTSYYNYFRAFREQYAAAKDIDVMGRFGYTFQGEFRRRAVDMLSCAKGMNFRGSGGKVRYSRFLREAAASRLCLHLPGNGPFTHRVAEFLGIGTCMVSLRFTTELHVPLQPGIHYVEIADDLSDLVEKCRYYLAHDDERDRIRAAATDYFDRYLHCDQMAGYYAHCLLDRLGERAR